MDGIIVINKPKGCTSHDIVYKVKKVFNEKVGHTGTLDPMAEGVLPILIGKGTLTSKYLINHDKKYIVKLKLGIKTDTADSEGKIIEKKEIKEEVFNKEKIIKILQSFIGEQDQVVHGSEPAYDRLRRKICRRRDARASQESRADRDQSGSRRPPDHFRTSVRRRQMSRIRQAS